MHDESQSTEESSKTEALHQMLMRKRKRVMEYNNIRKRILDNASVLHGPQPRVLHHGYTVFTTRVPTAAGDLHQAGLVSYAGPKWKTDTFMLRKSRKKESFLDAMKDLLDGMEVDLANLVKGVYPGKVISSKYAGPDVKQIEDDSTPTASPTKADISRSNHIKRSPIRRAPHVSISSTRQNLRSSSTRPQPAMVEMVAEIDNLLPPPLSNDPPESSKESNGKGVRSRRQLSRVTSTVQDWPNRNN